MPRAFIGRLARIWRVSESSRAGPRISQQIHGGPEVSDEDVGLAPFSKGYIATVFLNDGCGLMVSSPLGGGEVPS